MAEVRIPRQPPVLPVSETEEQSQCRSEINSDIMRNDKRIESKQKTSEIDGCGKRNSGVPDTLRSDESIIPLTATANDVVTLEQSSSTAMTTTSTAMRPANSTAPKHKRRCSGKYTQETQHHQSYSFSVLL